MKTARINRKKKKKMVNNPSHMNIYMEYKWTKYSIRQIV